jgi:membrane-bound lytic murein transglycosylase D
MRLQKSRAGLACCLLVALALSTGCSKNEVKKGPNITDSADAESTQAKAGRKKKVSRGSQYDTLWDRLFALYALPNIDHPDIDRELNWFASHPGYIERAQNRAEPFLYSIVKLVETKNVPGEIALLPIVESAFQPHVVSPARAAGIWQFIPSTGHNYGLKKSRSYDGRRDIYASTKAAIKYLKKLNNDFGDWLLAIAAYNCGEGNVAKAVRRNQAMGLPTDFWSLNLPQETRAYVPRLLAVARLFADSEKYGISLKDMPNAAMYKPVKVSNQLDLALAADAAGISLDKLYELNPGFKGQIADLDGSFHLYIPADKKAAEFRQEVERLHQERKPFSRSLVSGEEIPTEPAPFENFRKDFAKRSSSGADGDERSGGSSSRGSERHNDDNDGGSHGARTHEVQRGETLYSVSRKVGVDAASLARWNNISPRTQVQAGQSLIVSDPSASSSGSGRHSDHGSRSDDREESSSKRSHSQKKHGHQGSTHESSTKHESSGRQHKEGKGESKSSQKSKSKSSSAESSGSSKGSSKTKKK